MAAPCDRIVVASTGATTMWRTVAIEQHAQWVAECIVHMREQGCGRIDARPEALICWARQLDRAAAATLLSAVMTSWYRSANVPGKPRAIMPCAAAWRAIAGSAHSLRRATTKASA